MTWDLLKCAHYLSFYTCVQLKECSHWTAEMGFTSFNAVGLHSCPTRPILEITSPTRRYYYSPARLYSYSPVVRVFRFGLKHPFFGCRSMFRRVIIVPTLWNIELSPFFGLTHVNSFSEWRTPRYRKFVWSDSAVSD